MRIDPRVRNLVEKALDSDATPEEICRDTPELVPEVRAGIERLRSLAIELDAVFPDSAPREGMTESRPFRCSQLSRGERDDPGQGADDEQLPEIHGHEILEVIGQGGMGVVYRANDLCLRRVVAVKTLLSGVPKGPRELERFVREAQSAAGLTHPNIVQVHEVGNRDGIPYFTMEYVDGGTLAQWLVAAPRSAHDCAALVATLADAVEFAHRGGIVHRDLKPSNVLLTADGVPKIVDFGVAFRLDCDPGLTATHAPVGTPSYMAPEQARSETAAIGPRSDVYALGAILYEALTGRPPFRAENAVETLRQVLHDEPVAPSSFDPRLRRDLETICLKCLEKDPNRRYGSASELAADLRRFQRNEPIHARTAGRIERLYKWSKRHPARAALAASIVAAVALGMGAASWMKWRATALEQAVNADLDRATELSARSDWAGARAALDRASARLETFGCDDLRKAVAGVKSELDLVLRLDAIRIGRSTLLGTDHELRENWKRSARDYQSAIHDAGVGSPGEDVAIVASRIAGSRIKDAIVRALDDWAICVIDDPSRREWLLAVATSADPDPTGWRDRVRDPTIWSDAAASAELAAHVPLDGASIPLLLGLADRLERSGGDSTPFLRGLSTRHPDDYFVNQQLGVALGERGDEESIRFLQASVALRPDSPVAWNHVGVSLAQFGRVEEAIEHLEHARGMQPESASVHANLGNAYAHARRFDDAMSAFETALRLDPDGVSSRNNFARLLLERGRIDDAIAMLEAAVQIDPNYVAARSALGHALQRAGRTQEAVDCLQLAIELDPGHALARNNLALSLSSLGRVDEAVEHLQRAVEGAPRDPVIRTNLGNQLVRAGRDDEARREYETAIQFDPNLASAYHGLGIALGELGDYPGAITAFESAHRLEPGSTSLFGASAHAHYMMGEFAKARESARAFLDSAPERDPNRARVEVLLKTTQRLLALEPKLARIRAGEVVVEDPREALDLAEFCRRRGDFLIAAQFAAIGLELDPDLGDDVHAAIRLHAAQDALRAGSERSSPHDAETRAKYRERCRQWLREDLATFESMLGENNPASAVTAVRLAKRMLVDPALDSIRGESILALPELERGDCAALWREVAAFVERAEPIVSTISGTRPR